MRKLPAFKNTDNAEAAYAALSDDDRELALVDLPADTAIIRPEYLLPYLFNRKNQESFAKLFDGALLGVADDNIDIFSVKTGQGQAIKLLVVPDVLRKSRGPVVGGRFQSVDCMMPSSRDMSR